MEKKTIGAFIAALRKANGLTQRQLAEQLGVSDKTVSRWERDETAPDLSLIPVIAEFFGITSDELLRGERRSAEAPPAPKNQEKRLARILDQAWLQFRINTILTLGCALIGLLAALVGTYYSNIVGFFLGLICYLGAGISTAIAVLKATASLDSEELDCEKVTTLKRDILDRGYNTGSLLAALAVGTALLLNSSLALGEVILLGVPLAAGILFLALLLKWFLLFPRREDTALHELRVQTACNTGAVAGFALAFSAFFWLPFKSSETLIVGLIFTALAVPIGLFIYRYQKKKLK